MVFFSIVLLFRPFRGKLCTRVRETHYYDKAELNEMFHGIKIIGKNVVMRRVSKGGENTAKLPACETRRFYGGQGLFFAVG